MIAVHTVSGSTDTLNWLLNDQINSTSITANADGSLNSEIRYSAFGEIRFSNGITPTQYRYTGQLEQPSIGLDYYVARWYDPTIGRFVQPDSIIPDPAKVKAYDRYAYVENSPINHNDPSGHCIGSFSLFCVAAIVIIEADIVQTAVGLIATSDRQITKGDYPKGNSGSGICNPTFSNCGLGDEPGLKSFVKNDEKNPIPDNEFKKLTQYYASDLYEHDEGDSFGKKAGREKYDTEFFNGVFPSNEKVCIENKGCSGRSEVNYFAQGMWGAAEGDTLLTTLGAATYWKISQYKELPSIGTLGWTTYGYFYYRDYSIKQAEQNRKKDSFHNQ